MRRDGCGLCPVEFRPCLSFPPVASLCEDGSLFGAGPPPTPVPPASESASQGRLLGATWPESSTVLCKHHRLCKDDLGLPTGKEQSTGQTRESLPPKLCQRATDSPARPLPDERASEEKVTDHKDREKHAPNQPASDPKLGAVLRQRRPARGTTEHRGGTRSRPGLLNTRCWQKPLAASFRPTRSAALSPVCSHTPLCGSVHTSPHLKRPGFEGEQLFFISNIHRAFEICPHVV